MKQDLLAEYARRLLRHPEFNTTAKRLGKVLTVGAGGINVFERHRKPARRIEWTE